MTQRPGRGRRLPALSVALLAAAASLTGGVAAASPTAPPGSYSVPVAGRSAEKSITLVTGDLVKVTVGADGKKNYTVTGPDGLLADHEIHVDGANTYVYPRSALRFVAADLLDKNLFNVTELVADGFEGPLPLLVTYTDAATKARRQAVPAGARKVLSLTSIQGAALTAEKPADFWRSLTSASTARTTGKPVLAGGIAKVWLDGKVKADLSESTAQIGAPEVWAGGNIGKDVDVAVLDTGIDQEHPDLDDRVAAATSFVPDEEVADGHGHGTHVASTIAGTGDASDGKERGVAPGVRLHIGKVLNNEGAGDESWIIAGMEWAARDQHAKIVSMSLGGDPTDGTDPMSQAVDQLSAETGALFTIAGGNAGPSKYTIGSPGAADAALTVGAVDHTDTLAEFSSQGPRAGDGGLKPEITAPGVDILAARSQYAPGEGSYQLMSGTSMATPHVAGAAALLAAVHPDWTGAELKNALVSTAHATPQYSPYEAGSGRVDVAKAVKTTVFATSSVYSGYHGWPVAPGTTVDKVITYTNKGDTPVTLALTQQTANAPEGLFTLSAPSVTVPAHGTNTVTVTAKVELAPVDQTLSGKVVGIGADGVQVNTLIGIGREGERHSLTLNAKDRSGKPLAGDAILVGKKIFAPLYIPEGGGSIQLPVGDYTVWMTTDVEGKNGPHSLGLAVLTLLDIPLDRDRTATLDARKARELKTSTPQASVQAAMRMNTHRGFGPLDWSSSSRWPNSSYDSVWVLPTAKPREGEFVSGGRWRLEQPALTVGSFDDVLVRRGATPLPKGKQKLDVVLAGEGDAAAYKAVKARGKAVVVRRSDVVSREDQAAAAVAAGAKLLVVVNDGVGRLEPWTDSIYAPKPAPITIATVTADEGATLIYGRTRTLSIDSNPTTEYQYDVSHFWDAVPSAPTFKVEKSSLARVDVSYRNYQQGTVIERRDDTWNGDFTSSLNPNGTAAIGDRTDWVTAGVAWQTYAEILRETQQMEPVFRSYQAGSRTALSWFGPIQRPRLVADTSPRRLRDALNIVSPGWSDSGGDHIGTAFSNWDVIQKLSLYQGESLVSQADRDQLLVSGLRPERLPYKLVAENARGAWASPYSTSTKTSWEFTSAATDEVSQPSLLQLDYLVDTDQAGKAHRRADLTIAPKWSLSGGTVRTPSLELSYDDGKTWHRASFKKTHDGWTTRLDAPRGASAVSLRTHAEDYSTNSITQEITRAFGLK